MSLEQFSAWAESQFEAQLLSASPFQFWASEYIDKSYTKGLKRAASEVNKLGIVEVQQTDFFKQQNKVLELTGRVHSELKGATSAMVQEMNRIVADGIAKGSSNHVMVREMSKRIKALTVKRAKATARTETIRAFAEGQLDAYAYLGVTKLIVLAEFSTANDNKVCTECAELEGEVYTIKEARGIIPVHPNCRCAWLPVR